MGRIATDVWRGRSVGLSCNGRYPAKTAAPIEIPLGMWVEVGPSNQTLDGGPDPPRGRGNFGGKYGTPH